MLELEGAEQISVLIKVWCFPAMEPTLVIIVHLLIQVINNKISTVATDVIPVIPAMQWITHLQSCMVVTKFPNLVSYVTRLTHGWMNWTPASATQTLAGPREELTRMQ